MGDNWASPNEVFPLLFPRDRMVDTSDELLVPCHPSDYTFVPPDPAAQEAD